MAKLRWQFVLGAGVGSRLIAWYGQGYGGFSHVDAIGPGGVCLGARNDWIKPVKDPSVMLPPGVQVRPPGYEKWARREVLTLDCTDEEYLTWWKYLNTQVNTRYDQRDIMGFILGRPMMSAGEWICSALQYEGMCVLGRWKIATTQMEPQQVAPNALRFALLASGAEVESDTNIKTT